MSIVGRIAHLWRGGPESQERRIDRERLEFQRGTVKASQLGPLGGGRGAIPWTIAPTPDVLDDERH
jgi:hypothetical protein